jgi:hypothetical protein
MPFPFLDTTNDFSPINDIKTVTPNDSADLPNGACRAIIVSAAGNLVLDTAKGTTVTLAIPATATGVVQYIRAKRIRATGTTATVLACY